MIIIVPAAIVVLVAAVVIYNRLVAAQLRVKEAWSAIDVQLQRRASLIPNLVAVVQGYAAYERGTIERVVDARGRVTTAATPGQAAAANDVLTGALQSFFAVAEAYPALKANERFAELQAELAETENKIAYARNYYNGAVEIYNVRVQSFPSLLVAGPAGFRRAEFFGGAAAG